jgi:hypothetical protein
VDQVVLQVVQDRQEHLDQVVLQEQVVHQVLQGQVELQVVQDRQEHLDQVVHQELAEVQEVQEVQEQVEQQQLTVM